MNSILKTAIAVVGAMLVSNVLLAGTSNPPPPQPITCAGGDAVTAFSYGTLPTCGTPIAGGTINTGTAGQIADYSAATTVNPITTGTGVVTALGVNTGSAGAFVVNGGALGTPSAGTLTNAIGLPISTGVSGLGTGIATALAVNAGSAGAAVINGGVLGTPSSGTLTNLTGLPVSTGISGLGTGVATWLATPTGANLTTALSSGGGTTNFLRADGTFAAPPGGGGGGTIASTTSALAGDGAGNAVAVTGTGTNCVLVNGSSGACGAGSSVSVTAATPDITISPTPGTGTFTVAHSGRTVVADANCGTLTNSGTALVAFSTVLTAARSCTLPAASTMLPGQHIKFVDEGNGTNPAINGANTVTLNRAGADKIAGATSLVMGIGYCAVEFESDGVANYAPITNSCSSVPVTQGGTGATALTGHGAVVMNTGGTAQTTVAPSTSGNVLASNGTDWASAAPSVAIGGVTGLGTGVATAAAANLSAAGGLTSTIASGSQALNTAAISSATCDTVVSPTATNVATTDVVTASFNGDPTGVTGYIPATAGMLTIIAYPTSGHVNFKVCNNTGSSITPGAITLNWRVAR